MILYSDARTEELEADGQWLACIDYLSGMLREDSGNVSLFLKLAVNVWYTLAFDGPVLTLTRDESERLSRKLNELYKLFMLSFSDDINCQWLFGYMLTVRTDLSLGYEMDYLEIERQGAKLIKKARNSGNIFAKFLYLGISNKPFKKVTERRRERLRNTVREHILEYFDPTREVDRYFIEVLAHYYVEK